MLSLRHAVPRTRVISIRCASTASTASTGSTGSSASTPPDIDAIIRVDHAGELGADRIYAGQMAILGNTEKGPTIKHMWEQEKVHKEKFEELIRKYRVRPTIMTPIWNVAAFALGAGTALLGDYFS